ncbi:hypothetical protein F5X68DRAFT_51024 [Plectosphaerella plurivora]|uniref:Uncharacterized protein n=1 Tax=Plectosphaerella plurivora TaxID=936078 RepID=A0A9P8V308_9PEZI|nr:hypothetical protein F5X68DRAFT_51024 [Plectosphaerella plurivora]
MHPPTSSVSSALASPSSGTSSAPMWSSSSRMPMPTLLAATSASSDTSLMSRPALSGKFVLRSAVVREHVLQDVHFEIDRLPELAIRVDIQLCGNVPPSEQQQFQYYFDAHLLVEAEIRLKATSGPVGGPSDAAAAELLRQGESDGLPDAQRDCVLMAFVHFYG